ncbi:hypothetical protein [uncultured Sulfitobacter sp.]|uniref:hypothetical protein n=1 Tax=uncultured Sulfitobacter sp. TaxID=191468 RepID=UPI002603086F|nr:hypothetical protein [uncultured Sulfitobacter sp.]
MSVEITATDRFDQFIIKVTDHTNEDDLYTVPTRYIDAFIDGELSVVGEASTALGTGFSSVTKQIGASHIDGTVANTVTFNDACI